MTRSRTIAAGVAAALSLTLVAAASGAQAQDNVRKPARHAAAAVDASGRPLTIGGRRRASGPGDIVVSHNGDEIYAPGGFSAHGYGWGPPGSEQAERAARNASVTSRSANAQLGLNGIGAFGFGDRGESGYNNPFYGNSYNRYVGYNGTPADLAFGPAFANRHITSDAGDDDGREGLSPIDRNTTGPLFGDDD